MKNSRSPIYFRIGSRKKRFVGGKVGTIALLITVQTELGKTVVFAFSEQIYAFWKGRV